MQQYALKRIALFFPTILLITIIVFVVMRLIPGDVCIAILSDGEASYTQAELDDCRIELDLNDPLFIQYTDWI
ncbi:MAG: glutathione ABC transporter permease GsiC, partial [bacterium]